MTSHKTLESKLEEIKNDFKDRDGNNISLEAAEHIIYLLSVCKAAIELRDCSADLAATHHGQGTLMDQAIALVRVDKALLEFDSACEGEG